MKVMTPCLVAAVIWMGLGCLGGESFGATGSSSADSWYVRPAGTCAYNGDGLAYGCAASVGSSGAFKGFPGIRWVETVGVDDGDTLYVCGEHRTELRPLAKATNQTRIVITGACPGDQGSIDTTSLMSNTVDGIRFEGIGIEGYTVQDISVFGSRTGILVHASAPKSGFTFQRITFDQSHAYTMTNACHELSFIGSSTYAYRDITIRDNDFLGTNCANHYNDAIHLEKAIERVLIENNRVSGSGTAGGIDISGPSTGDYKILRNTIRDTFNVAIRIEGSLGCPRGLTIDGNVIHGYGSWGMSLIDVSDSSIVNNVVFGLTPYGGSSPSYGAVILRALNACANTNNAFFNNTLVSDYVEGVVVAYTGTRAAFEAGNTWDGNLMYQTGTFQTLFGFLADRGNAVTEENFSVWQEHHPLDRN